MRPIDTVDVEDVQCPPARPLRALPRARGGAHHRAQPQPEDAQGGADAARARTRRRRAHRAEAAEARRRRTRREIGTRVDIERPRLWQPGRPAALLALGVGGLAPRQGARRPLSAPTGSASACGSSRRRRGVLYLNGQAAATCAARASTRTTSDRRGAHPRHPLAPGAPAARPRRDGHPLALSAAPRVPRGLRPARDPLLGAGPGLPAAQLLLRSVPAVRASATRAVRLTVANNLNHPSVFAWSLVNEPAGSRLRARASSAAGLADLHPRGAPRRRASSTTRA